MPLTVSFRGDGSLRSTRASQRRFRTMTVSSFRPIPSTRNFAPATQAPQLNEPFVCDFYENVWYSAETDEANQVMTRVATATGVRTTRRRRNPLKQRLIDVSQVAYVLTSVLEFRGEYPHFTNDRTNIWGSSTNPADLYEYSEEDVKAQSRKIVSPIQSQQHMPRVPQSAPQLRASMILNSAQTEPERAVDETVAADASDEEPERETPEQDDGHSSSYISASTGTSGPRELNRTPSVPITDAKPIAKKSSSGSVAAPPLSVDTAIPPPSTRNGSVIFSSVFVEKIEWNWSVRFLLGIHEPIRHALFVMDRFLEQSHKQQQVMALEHHTTEFFAWFKTYFVEYIKSQHDVKIKVLYPLVKVKPSTKQEILRTYSDIYALLSQIQQQEYALLPTAKTTTTSTFTRTRTNRQSLERPAWLVRLDTLQKSIRRLNMTLHGVLNLEEKTLNPAMAAAFNEKTFQEYVMPRLFRAMHAKKVVIPWIVERSKVWGGETEQKSLQGMLPMTSRFLYKKIWRPYFMSNVAVAMKNLNEFDLAAMSPPEHERREEIFGCAIQ